ncbi:MAG: hypothetical protein ACI9HY_004228, partial [Planctomycetaceae bacterium]
RNERNAIKTVVNELALVVPNNYAGGAKTVSAQ